MIHGKLTWALHFNYDVLSNNLHWCFFCIQNFHHCEQICTTNVRKYINLKFVVTTQNHIDQIHVNLHSLITPKHKILHSLALTSKQKLLQNMHNHIDSQSWSLRPSNQPRAKLPQLLTRTAHGKVNGRRINIPEGVILLQVLGTMLLHWLVLNKYN